MRIISGKLKGRHLKSPKGHTIRPTSDKVKEAIFNVLNTKVQSARVLDLFAGTGNLALEALSRGAGSAVLVDASRQAVRLMQENIKILDNPDRAQIIHEDARRFIRRYSGERFDLVFMDPPYCHGLAQDLLPELQGKVSLDGVVVVETGSDETVIAEPFEIRIVKEYGDSKVWFLQEPEETPCQAATRITPRPD
jgi:16S rRNA (guanine966-N2)-methyltransferase